MCIRDRANYGLDRWLTLPRYIPEEDTRLLLKNCYRQYRKYSKVQTILKNNLDVYKRQPSNYSLSKFVYFLRAVVIFFFMPI